MRSTRLGGWTFGFVVANQVALFVVTVLAGSVAGPDPVSSYTYAYAFFQLPYGVIAVTVMSVVTPDLADRWSTGQLAPFLHRLTGGLRAVLALIIPSAVGMLLLARPAVALLLGVGHSTPAETATAGAALAMFALGLPGFCTYLYFVRVLQSMQRTRVAFYLYLVENGLNIVLALALVHPLGVRGLALSLSIAYTVAALAALAVFRQWFGRLAERETWAPLWRVVVASDPHGRGGARGVEPLGVDEHARPAGPGGGRRGGRWPHLRRGRRLAGPTPRRAAAPAGTPRRVARRLPRRLNRRRARWRRPPRARLLACPASTS